MVDKRRLVVAIGVGVVAVGAWLGYARSKKPAAPASPPYAFDMCVAHSPPDAPVRLAWNDAVLSAVARTLTPEERASLEEALGNAAVRWEAKANPVLEDLEGGDPDTPLIGWFKKGPPFLRTAQASSRLRACAPDGFCALPRPKHGACPEGTTPPVSADEDDRARFIQWSWGHALRFRAPSADAATSAATALRAGVRTSRAIAIVLAADDGDVTKKEPFVTLRDRWTKVEGFKRAARRSSAAAQAKDVFVVDEAAADVVVMPRHDAMASKTPDATVEADVLKLAPQLAH